MITILKRFKNDKRGATTVVFAGFAIVLLLVAGASIDVGRAYLIRNKVQLAMDAALLGGTANLTSAQLNGNMATREAAVQLELENLFQANYPTNFFNSTVSGLNVQETRISGASIYAISVDVVAPNTIMSLFGFPQNNITIVSQVTLRDPRSLELTLVLDVTGSMSNPAVGGGTRLEALQNAVGIMVNTIYDNVDPTALHLSIVPYNTGVNLGNTVVNQVRKLQPFNPATGNGWLPDWFSNEVADRNVTPGTAASNPFSFTDTPPSANEDTRFVHPDDATISGFRGNPVFNETNLTTFFNSNNAPATDIPATEFALTNRNDILTSVSNFTAQGGTRINVGLMWGWYTLSSRWRGIFDNTRPTIPASSGPTVDKILVVMTDGQNNLSTDDDETAMLCTNINNEDITIYSVGFGPVAGTPGSVPANLLQGCASRNEFFFFAPGAAELSQAFAEITDDILGRLLSLTQ